MKLALTTNARLYKTAKGEYFTASVYDYNFFLRYLDVFEEVKLIAHVEETSNEKTQNMVRVDGPRLEVCDVPFPHGKLDYLKKYVAINKTLKKAYKDCEAAILRIPDQLAFQIYKKLKNKMPVAVEITTDSWSFFSPTTYKRSLFRPILRISWHTQQKKICKNVLGTSYVTRNYLQQKYPYSKKEKCFTTFYTDTDIDETWLNRKRMDSSEAPLTILHVATAIDGMAKGHKELLTAVGELRRKGYKIKIVLVGKGELNEENKQIVQEYGLEDSIDLTGSLTREVLKEIYFSANAFVFPSYVEGLPRVLVEAMAAGLPCVATELPGIRELLSDECLVPVKDVEILQQKIQALTDFETRERLGAQNKEIAREYSIDEIEKKRKAFYLKLKDSVQK